METRQHDFCKMAANYLEAQQMVLHFAWTHLNDSALCRKFHTLQTSELKRLTMGSVQVPQSMPETCKSDSWSLHSNPRITGSMETIQAISMSLQPMGASSMTLQLLVI